MDSHSPSLKYLHTMSLGFVWSAPVSASTFVAGVGTTWLSASGTPMDELPDRVVSQLSLGICYGDEGPSAVRQWPRRHLWKLRGNYVLCGQALWVGCVHRMLRN